MLKKLLEFFDRSVYYIEGSAPAAFYLADKEGGGIMINSPAFSAELLAQLNAIMPVSFIFYPSYMGAHDVDQWREASGAQTMCYGHESKRIRGKIDKALEREDRFSRTVDFLVMSGRTESSCMLRCKNKPGILFFGPILDTSEDGWPTLILHDDDFSRENRLIGALGLQDLKFDYAFTDDFKPDVSQYGPGADAAIQSALQRVYE